MTDSAAAVPGKGLPLRHSSRSRRLLEIFAWLAGIAVVVAILELLGVDVTGWFSSLWDQIKAVPVEYIVVGLVFQSGQTIFAGLSYYGILSAAYPGEVSLAPIVTAYAVGVAMNNFLPANIGTFVTLLMFVALIPSAPWAARSRPIWSRRSSSRSPARPFTSTSSSRYRGHSTSTSGTSPSTPAGRSSSLSEAAS